MRFLSLSCLCGLAFAIPSPSNDEDHLGFTPPDLGWKDCGEALQCGNLTVPLDWDAPDGPTISMYVNRLKAKTANASEVIGSLVFNPGGPGGSGTRSVGGFASKAASKLHTRFDTVGLDPRGVGYSTPLNCKDKQTNTIGPDWPDTQSELDILVQGNKDYAQSCLSLTGNVVKHLDTISVAKDLEALRIALGGQKLNYIGLSYGTQIAATYLSLYPRNIRAVVMDGNVDHTTDKTTAFTTETIAYEASLNRFMDWCEKNETCALHGQAKKPREIWSSILDQADKGGFNYTVNCEPVGCAPQKITAEPIIAIARGFMYTPDESFVLLGKLLNKTANSSDPSSLLEYAGVNNQPQPPLVNRTRTPGFAVTCLDWDTVDTLSEFIDLKTLGNTLAPLTRGCCTVMSNILRGCSGWPFKNPKAGEKKLGISEDVPKVLLVQSTFDPACMYEGAVNLHRQIPNSVLLTRDGDGHCSYPTSEEARKFVDDYLVNLTLPEPNTVIKSNSLGDGYGSG